MVKPHITWVKVREEYTFPALRGEATQGYYIDQVLKSNLDHIIEGVKQKWDGTAVITGLEGSGKSTAAFMTANYCDPSFKGEEALRRTIFTADQFYEVLENAKPGQAVVWDEMVLAGSSGDATSSIQKALVKTFTLIRKKRLFIILVIPSIFMLQTYFALFRTRFLIHVYSPNGIERGFFKFYSYDKKRELYFKGKKNNWNMAVVRPDFYGQVRNYTNYFIDDDKYNDKKDAVTTQINKEENAKESIRAKKAFDQNSIWMLNFYNNQCISNPKYSYQDCSNDLRDRFGQIMVYTAEGIRKSILRAKSLVETNK